MTNKFYGKFNISNDENFLNNLEVYKNYNFVLTDEGYINIFEYLLCYDNGFEISKSILHNFGIKNINRRNYGYIYTLIFLLKDKYFLESEINIDFIKILSKQEKINIISYINNEIPEFTKNKNLGDKLNLLDKAYLTAIALGSHTAIDGYLDYLQTNKSYLKYKKNYKVEKITDFYIFDSEIEADNFENIIFSEDPKKIYKINYYLSMDNIYNPFYGSILVSLPYHVYYKYMKAKPPIFSILYNTYIENVFEISNNYGFNKEINTYKNINESKDIYCFNEFIKHSIFLLKDTVYNEDNKNILYGKYLYLNSFINYCVNCLEQEDDDNVKLKNNYQTFLKKNINDCNLDIESFKEFNDNIKIHEIFKLHKKSHNDTLYVYKFEESLFIEDMNYWDHMLIYPENKNLINYITPLGLEDLNMASKINTPIIFTEKKEYYKNLKDFTNQFNITAIIMQIAYEELPKIIEELYYNKAFTNLILIGKQLYNCDNLIPKLNINIKYFIISLMNEKYLEDLKKYTVSEYIQEIKYDPKKLAELPFEFKNDNDIVSEALEIDGKTLKYASDKIKDNKEMVLKAIENDALAYNYASNILKNDSDIIIAVLKKNGAMLKYIPEQFKDNEIYFNIALNNNPLAYCYTSLRLRSIISNAVYALERNPNIYNCIPDNIKNNYKIKEKFKEYFNE